MGRKKKKPAELPPPEDDDEDWAAEAAALLAEAEIEDGSNNEAEGESKAEMLRRHKDELKALKEEARLAIPKGAEKDAKKEAEAEYKRARAALEEQHASQLAVFDVKPDPATEDVSTVSED